MEKTNSEKTGIDFTVLIPTKNEAANIAHLIAEINKVREAMDVRSEILVVDAESGDETAERAVQAGAKVIFQERPFYAGAILDGIAAANGKYVLTIDADFSHPPHFIKDLWDRHDAGELGICSRFVKGGKSDMPVSRYLLSIILNKTFSLLLGLPVKDMSSGYRLYNKEVISRFDFQGEHLSILQEMVFKLHSNGYKIYEVPFHYMPRKAEQSKTQVFRYGMAHLRTLLRLFKQRISGKK